MVHFTTIIAAAAPMLAFTSAVALPEVVTSDPRNITPPKLTKRADTGVYYCQNQGFRGPCFWQDNPGAGTCVTLTKPWGVKIGSCYQFRLRKSCKVYV